MISAPRLCNVVNGGGSHGTIALIQPHSLRVLVVHLTRHTPLELSGTRGTGGTGALTDHRG